MNKLTPRRSQTLRFPRLGIKIEVDRPSDDTTLVHVGIPDRFFTNEFTASRWFGDDESSLSESASSKRRHAICNRMHVASLALEMLQNRSSDDEVNEIEHTLDIAVESLTELEQLASNAHVQE